MTRGSAQPGDAFPPDVVAQIARHMNDDHAEDNVLIGRGLGAALAQGFAAEGAHLILVARTTGALEEVDDRVRAAGGQATLVPLDLLESVGIDRLGGALVERYGHLDVLIGNAGALGALSPLGHIQPQGFERVMAPNATANYRLIRSLDPPLRAAHSRSRSSVLTGTPSDHVAFGPIV